MSLQINSGFAEISGRAALYHVADSAGDVIMPDAFQNIQSGKFIPLKESRVKMLYQHKVDCPVGIWNEVRSDEKGLFVRGCISLSTRLGRDVYAMVREKIIDGLSIGFRVGHATKGRGGIRTISQATLWEISIVTFPMASGARITRVGEPNEHPARAGLSTQTARRASFPPSGARHLSLALTRATDLLS